MNTDKVEAISATINLLRSAEFKIHGNRIFFMTAMENNSIAIADKVDKYILTTRDLNDDLNDAIAEVTRKYIEKLCNELKEEVKK